MNWTEIDDYCYLLYQLGFVEWSDYAMVMQSDYGALVSDTKHGYLTLYQYMHSLVSVNVIPHDNWNSLLLIDYGQAWKRMNK